jgi:hypothetical protein
MGNCSCLERPKKVTAWDHDDDNNGGMKVKIRMTKGYLRRLREIMSMGVVAAAEHRQAVEAHHSKPPPKLGTIREDDFDE